MSDGMQPAEALVVVDPDLDADLARLIRTTAPEHLPSPAPESLAAPWTGAMDAFGEPMAMTGTMLIPFGLLAGGVWVAVAPLATVAVVGAVAVPKIRKLAQQRTDVERLGAVRQRYILTSELIDEAAQLLVRAVRASEQIMDSAVHLLDLVDSARNATGLPVEQWEIAVTLRSYSRLSANEPAYPAGNDAREVLSARRQAMAISLTSIQQRVEALEAYAARTREADRRLRELQQIEHLAQDNEAVLDLVARTARDEHAIADLQSRQGLQHVDEHLITALSAAREAAVIALPPSAVGADCDRHAPDVTVHGEVV
ncbi:hypothetical protein ACWDBD_41040 [Streptomyces sp. NPDC001118]